MRWFRMHPDREDPTRLLVAEGQWTEPWGRSCDGAPCEKCGGSGRTAHRCWSCLLDAPRESCPACAGRVAWRATCPVCRGCGRVDAAPRRGVSVFPTALGLYHYMLRRKVDLEGCVVLELEGRELPDVDFDADEGAVLVIPTAIVSCEQPDRALASRLRARVAAGRA